MEHIQPQRITHIQVLTSQRIVLGLLIFFSMLFGALNFIVPTQYLIAIVLITVMAVLLFMYPFVGLLAYQFITVFQPGVIFPSLAPLHVERLMAIFLIIALIINIKLRREKLVFTQHQLVYLLVFFILAMVISIPSSYWHGQSVRRVIDFLKTFAFFLLIINILKTDKRLKLFIWQYLLLMGYMAVSSAIAYKTGNVMEAQGIIRAQGLAGTDPNTLALSLDLSLPFHFMLFRMEKNKFIKAFSLLLVAVTIYTIILTGSRGGLLGLVTIVGLSWWFLPKRGIRLFLLAAAAFVIIAIMPEQYQERYASIFSEERDASSEERIKVWNKGINMFIDRPFLGVGTGAFTTANAEGYSEGRKSYLAAHNLYIQLAAELGIVGFIAFSAYVAGLFIYQHRYRKFIERKFKQKNWLWGCLMAMTIAVICLMVVGMFGHNLYRSNWYYYGALTISIGFVLRQFSTIKRTGEVNGAQ